MTHDKCGHSAGQQAGLRFEVEYHPAAGIVAERGSLAWPSEY